MLALAFGTPASGHPAARYQLTIATATLSLSAPIAVPAKTSLAIRGSVSPTSSVGETVTITLQRYDRGWSDVTTSAVTVDAHSRFTFRAVPAQRGHWRVRAYLPAGGSHNAATATRTFKVVGSKIIALTFDDGPWPRSTAAVVSALQRNDVEATFFMLGSQIGGRAALARSVLAHGNSIGIHSWNHALMTRRSAAINTTDLKRCKKALRKATGLNTPWFRPPYGAISKPLRKTAAALDLTCVLWTVDTLDWKYRVKSSIVSRALASARNGGVILMHDGGGPRAATVAAVPTVIRRLRAKGYDFVTLDEMTALGRKIP